MNISIGLFENNYFHDHNHTEGCAFNLNHNTNQLLFGPYGTAGLEKGGLLKEYGTNAVWFHGFDPIAFDTCSRFDLAACVEFKPHGIWFDYLTYAGWFESADPDLQESCFCKTCIEEFCEATGIDEQNPNLILKNHAELWKRHKCERIAGYACETMESTRIKCYDEEDRWHALGY